MRCLPWNSAIQCFIIVLVISSPHNLAGMEPSHRWNTGNAFHRQLKQPIGFSWSETPLRDHLKRFSQTVGVAILLDRRVDPGQKVEFSIKNTPLKEGLEQLAAGRNLGLTIFGSVVYFGPPEPTAKLRTLAAIRRAEVRKLSISAQKKFLTTEPLVWPDFSMPGDLIRQLAVDHELELVGGNRIPHDLWAEADLPPMNLIDRLTLIAGQFDLTFRISPEGTAIALVPVPERVVVVRDYPGGLTPEKTVAKWQALAPSSRLKIVGKKIYVEGSIEDHERITKTRRPPRHSTPTPKALLSNQRFTIPEVDAPALAVLKKVADQNGLVLSIDQSGLDREGISLESSIKFAIENATFEELIEAILKPLGCDFRLKGSRLEIGPKKP